jgi:hypothetical protein
MLSSKRLTFIKESRKRIQLAGDLPKKRLVAIVVPFFKKNLTPEEEISLKHLRHFLGRYDKYLLVPDNMNLGEEYKDFFIKKIKKNNFSSLQDYNNMMLSKEFYQLFSDYEYILIYQLDALVFSDQLAKWCQKRYDYIGAPWFKAEVLRALGIRFHRNSVGNGGFSLRRVQAFIDVLTERNHLDTIKRKPFNIFHFMISFFSNPPSKQENEDLFWSFEAKRYLPSFKIPSPEIAVSFAFEVGPRYCFSRNNNTLPFGCHAWDRYDRKFWEPYLLK